MILPDRIDLLAEAISTILASGQMPQCLKESTTVVLRKEQKKDYTLASSYRPIALENTLAKLIEKVVADKITYAAETNNLLPWNQMGARKNRSTISGLDLLVSTIQTAWKSKKGTIVSMLSLDISGAFDNVSHKRLLWTLDKLGLPEWMVRFTASFLSERRTRIIHSGSTSEWIPTANGIPQGSTISPILFLLFISDLLKDIQNPAGGMLGFGFVDDTNLVAWGPSAEANCRTLERAHNICLTWAYRHGAKFAPEKYHLIHFTRKRKDPGGDLRSCVNIDNHEITAETSVRVLGVQIGSRLKWHEHIEKAAIKGQRAFEALSRITASTWGPSVQRSRLVYTAVVRPVMLYGAQVWGVQDNGDTLKKSTLKPLKTVQNKCLRRIMGAYKRTPIAALEREAQVMPLDIQLDLLALQRSASIKEHQVTKDTAQATRGVWTSLQHEEEEARPRGRGRPRTAPPTSPPGTALSAVRQRAEERVIEMMAHADHLRELRKKERRKKTRPNGRATKPLESTLLAKWANLTWRNRWREKQKNQKATTWHTPWTQSPLKLYSNLPKHEATALFLLRTEVLGLNSWLASINVPNITPSCSCGWPQQTVRHVLLFCLDHSEERESIIRQTGTTDLYTILNHGKGSRIAARWLARSGLLAQFTTANHIQDDEEPLFAIPDINYWTI